MNGSPQDTATTVSRTAHGMGTLPFGDACNQQFSLSYNLPGAFWGTDLESLFGRICGLLAEGLSSPSQCFSRLPETRAARLPLSSMLEFGTSNYIRTALPQPTRELQALYDILTGIQPVDDQADSRRPICLYNKPTTHFFDEMLTFKGIQCPLKNKIWDSLIPNKHKVFL